MNIEIGKQYAVSNRWKKTLIETNFFVNDDGACVQCETVWRSGTFLITPQNQDEVNMIVDALDEDYSDTFEPYAFEEVEFSDTYDGCSEDYSLETGDFDLDTVESEYYDNEELQDEYFSFGSYLEDALGFSMDDTEYAIAGSIMINEE